MRPKNEASTIYANPIDGRLYTVAIDCDQDDADPDAYREFYEVGYADTLEDLRDVAAYAVVEARAIVDEHGGWAVVMIGDHDGEELTVDTADVVYYIEAA